MKFVTPFGSISIYGDPAKGDSTMFFENSAGYRADLYTEGYYTHPDKLTVYWRVEYPDGTIERGGHPMLWQEKVSAQKLWRKLRDRFTKEWSET